MTLSELINMYRKEAGDTANPPFMNDDELISLINDAEEEASIRAKLIFERSDEAICEIDLSAGESVYKIDSRVTEITRAYVGEEDYFILDMRAGNKVPVYGDVIALIQHDTTIEIVPTPTVDATLRLECYRLPANKMEDADDEPEIGRVHHKYLLDWVKHRVYSMQDADMYDSNKSLQFESRFERHFGKHPGAKKRRPQNANIPHKNKVW